MSKTKVLKNYTRERVTNIFRGGEVYFGPKESKKFDLKDEEERALYYFWKERYGFIQDITNRGDLKL